MAKYAIVPQSQVATGSMTFPAKGGEKITIPMNGAEVETDADLSEWVGQYLTCIDGAKKKPAIKVEQPAEPKPEPVRARTDEGQFVADDPTTPENEAYRGGVGPEKSAKKKLSKAAKLKRKKESEQSDD